VRGFGGFVITMTATVLVSLTTASTAAADGPLHAIPSPSAGPLALAQTTPTCGNQQLSPKPGGGTWTCTFDDEFDATTGDASALNTSWWSPLLTANTGYVNGPAGEYDCYVNSPNNISVSNGALHLTVRQEAAPFSCGGLVTSYTSGMVTTVSKFTQTDGRFEVRALVPSTLLPGLQETFWLYPQNLTYGPWPASGEIDLAEFYSLYSLFDVPAVHYNFNTANPFTSTNTTSGLCTINVGQYNTFDLTWEPGTLTMAVNGNTCLTDNYRSTGTGGSPTSAPFDQPFFIALTQALGVGLNTYIPFLTPLPATTSIDYVRVWR
jgi:beta-glucanase (GH16 family)